MGEREGANGLEQNVAHDRTSGFPGLVGLRTVTTEELARAVESELHRVESELSRLSGRGEDQPCYEIFDFTAPVPARGAVEYDGHCPPYRPPVQSDRIASSTDADEFENPVVNRVASTAGFVFRALEANEPANGLGVTLNKLVRALEAQAARYGCEADDCLREAKSLVVELCTLAETARRLVAEIEYLRDELRTRLSLSCVADVPGPVSPS